MPVTSPRQPRQPTEFDFLTVREFADFIGYRRKKVRAMIAAGEVKTVVQTVAGRSPRLLITTAEAARVEAERFAERKRHVQAFLAAKAADAARRGVATTATETESPTPAPTEGIASGVS